MAEAIAKRLLAEHKRVPIDQLEASGVRVRSAGVMTSGGSPASEYAVETVGQIGVDLSKHTSTAVTEDLIQDADVIYAMTESHRQALIARSPLAESKTHLLSADGDIIDPYGSPLAIYAKTAAMIGEAVAARMTERFPGLAGGT